MMRLHASGLLRRLKPHCMESLHGDTAVPLRDGEGKPSSPPVSQNSQKWITAAASVAGSSHLMRGSGSDDWFRLDEQDGVLVAVVTDGMGSARFGAFGARAAAAATYQVIRRATTKMSGAKLQTLIEHGVAVARATLAELAQKLCCDERDFASTLVCAVLTEQWLAVGQVGDCSAVVLDTDGKISTILPPVKGTYANETKAIGSGEDALVVNVLKRQVQALALFSDGLERIALNRGAPYSPFLVPLWEFLADAPADADEQIASLLESERMRRATDDDCTLVLAYRRREDKPR